ncbi:MAG TPA: ZIP family metal transporter [Candidatus Ornithoclostridium faecavium]|nr:ZIP family metal transporter [Candidatus Ornithoclostridium faecavium]
MSNAGIVALGFSLIFLFTCAGSATVYLFKGEISPKLNTLFLGFAAGVMIAATIWSLLLPSMEGAMEIFDNKYLSVLPAAVGFIVGGLFLVFLDKVIPHFHFGTDKEEGHRSNFQKTTKLFLAVTIHNIPEGIAAGVAFGAAASLGDQSAYLSALGLAIGLGLQNFPEGASVALPMKNLTGSKHKAFLLGSFSGIVEPIFAFLGFYLAAYVSVLQPWLLAFAGGAMIFVVAEDLIPDAKLAEHPHLGTWGVMAGFVIMMILDVVLG